MKKGISRRTLFKGAPFFLLQGCALVSSKGMNKSDMTIYPSCEKGTFKYLSSPETRVIHTVCLGCNARCGIKAFSRDGKIETVTGNPYHPYNTLGQPISLETPLEKSLKISGSVCGKAKEISNYVFSPYRILMPLKRAGKRGEGKFEPIEWERLITEIVNGGRLFSHLGEDRHVPGLKDLLSDEPLDPDAPELGPKRNGFCFMTGRLQHGRKAFIDRFVKYAFGSVNRIGHTDICGLGFRMGNYAFTEGEAVELKADPWSAKYIIIFGANVYEALQPGLNTYGAALAKRAQNGDLKFVIVDPRAQKASAHAHRWVSIRPGQDGAFALGIIRWLIENKRFNRQYLEAPNSQAALELGNGAYVNATHLVVWDENDPRHGKFLRLGDVSSDVSKEVEDHFVVVKKGGDELVSYIEVKSAELNVDKYIEDGEGKRIRVRSAFNIMQEGVFEHSIEDYARFSGVDKEAIEEVAREFSDHAPYASVCQYHGAGNYVNGTYAAYAVAALNALSGSIGRKGGYISSGGGFSSWKKGSYDLLNFQGKRKPRGIKISREKADYRDSTEYGKKQRSGENPYPANRPWFPFTKGGLSVEALSGIDTKYPYPITALFLYFFNPVYSIPGGNRFKATLSDPDKVPLLVSIDIGINESNIFADYIIPDITYAEGHYGWLSPHAPAFKFTAVRSPIIEPVTSKTRDGRPICLETFLIDLAEAMNLPGFGQNAIPGKNSRVYPLKQAEDFYLRGFSNIAENANLRCDDTEAIGFVEKNYPVSKFKAILTNEEWRRVCVLLSRGGLFSPYESCFGAEAFKYGPKRFTIYNEALSNTVCSVTGRPFYGSLRYVPPMNQGDRDFPFTLISYKQALHTQSRTIWHKVALELHPQNFVLMNQEDAARLKLKDGELVRVKSRSNRNGVVGELRTTWTIRPGTVAISISYGHKGLGASSLTIRNAKYVMLGGETVTQGDIVISDQSLGKGINPNELSDLDYDLGNTPLIDLVGGIPDFSSTCVRVEPV